MQVAFRADASAAIGSGHVMRCLALADALRERGAQCRFLTRAPPAALVDLITSSGHELQALDRAVRVEAVADAAECVTALHERVDWLVVDHYTLDASWETPLRARAHRVMAIDDLADRAHDCDLLLDQNFYLDLETRYDGRVPAQCRTLLGPEYALLRKEFRAARVRARVRAGVARRLQIFFGGMDAANLTTVAIEALSRMRHSLEIVDVVIGASHADRSHITQLCAANGYTLHVQTADMADLMRTADVALGAGGSASWERCCVGLPALLVAVADNQRALVRDSAQAGFAFAPELRAPVADFFVTEISTLLADTERLTAMSKRGMELVDGRGVDRVARAMGLSPVRVRAAAAGDSRQLFHWRNHPDIRGVSRNPAEISWSQHEDWFNAVHADPARPLLIGEASGRPVGVVRFDIDGDRAEVSIYKVPEHAAAASGSDLLVAAETWLHHHRPQVNTLTATVLESNTASRRLFEANGYRVDGDRYLKRKFE